MRNRARSPTDYGQTVSVLATRNVLRYARTRGVNNGTLARELRIDPASLEDPEGRIPLAVHRRAWALAAFRSHDPAFGLHLAERSGIGTMDALDYALWASATLDDAIERIVRFYRLLGDDLELHLVRSGRFARLHRVVHDERHRAEAFFAFVVLRARELVGRTFRIHEVRFMHRAPSDTKVHRAVFRCPVRFSCPSSELVFAADQLEMPVKTARPGLAAILDRYMKDLVARLPDTGSLLHRVTQAITRTLRGGRPSLQATARALHSSPRTLQRHLQDLGVTHRVLVEDARRDMADRLLQTRKVSVTEVAFLLGFEDVSGFRRAYRRWTGTNPTRARIRR
ncbi:MAG: AraC family transcriptional regulator [Kofleriaceae bacterium]|nr:AraC family transcriptional regulator [Kofleriaceae bacterium]